MKKILGFAVFSALFMGAQNSFAQQVGTIGVGDIRYSAESSDDLLPVESVLSAIDSGINSALIKTRKFTVLDYAQLKARIDKQDRTLEDYYEKKYVGNAVNQSGLDYILKANVTEFGFMKQARAKSDDTVGLIDIDFELIGVADATADFSSSVSAQYSERIKKGDVEAGQDVLDKAIQKGVELLVDRVISGLFPIRVMKISDDGAITLNYGEGLLEPGDTVLVYPKDAEIVIDETGKVMGNAVATLKIINTERKFAIAQALDGQDALEKGQRGQLVLSGG